MVGWRLAEQEWRGLLAAVLLGIPAGAGAERDEGGPPPDPSESVTQAEPPSRASGGAEHAAAPRKVKPADSMGEDPAGADKVDDAAQDSDAPVHSLRLFGRVFAQARADERANYARSLSIPSARVGVEASFPNVDAELSADLASKSILKDAFVRLSNDSKRLRLYGGRFKAPFLERELGSSWTLPLQGRGLVADYLVDTNDLGGRRLGVMGEARWKEAWGLKVSAGLFQGAEGETGERLSEDGAMRVTLHPLKRLTVGASTYLTQVFDGTRQYALSTDAQFQAGALLLAAEGVAGQVAMGPFTAQLVLASWLVGLGQQGWALQPVLGAEALQLRIDAVTKTGHALVGGLNLLLADLFKVQLQVERALRPGEPAAALELSLQLATRFQ
ncbi:hypothetical protein DRW03_01270 [Corallococcus sp. H22C18031201]|uniref:hypothetical protein n=1 Tax=Citreicoccus inhibens TaxID=2849499 RepID=UPI000E749AE1|nr:hypothetical protein [Citreicoccus inhibens]MBU8894872.1 OprO/OprP family phosphate-selective porin [Citreicoccus inhibens]RJS27042.1 hypothetical protein DRW03_01270 [Corallococcus sp. H22C18031201]